MGDETTPPVVDNSPQSLLEKAEAVAKRIEEANKNTAEMLKRQEEIEAKKILGGRSTVAPESNMSPEQTKQKKAEDMSKEIVGAFR